MLSALTLSLTCLATPAGAVVETASGTAGCDVSSESCYGVQPRNGTTWTDGNGAEGETFKNPAGRPVLHSPGTYAIYWDPGDIYRPEWQGVIDGFFANLGAGGGELTSVFANDQQYIDGSERPASDSFVFHGAYTDTEPYPSHGGCVDPHPPTGAVACLTDVQIRSQLETFIAQHGLQEGMGTIFYVLTPPGVTVCVDGGGVSGHCSDHTGSIAEETQSYKNSFCSYHSDISPTNPLEGGASTIIYAVVPWTAGGEGSHHQLPPPGEPAYDCQDGGFNPSSDPIEEREHAKEHSKAEIEAINGMSGEEKQKQEEKELREAPHAQEPNQGTGPGWAGDYAHGLADLIVNQIAVEQQNTATDPLLDAWQDTAHNELTDECRNFFESGELAGSVVAQENSDAGTLANQPLNGHEYYLNTAFNLAADRLPFGGVPCVGGVSLDPQFTATNPVNAGEVVGFDGMESDVSLNGTGLTLAGTTRYATYTWNYGDGGLGDATPVVSGYAPGSAPCEAPWLSTEPPASLKPPGVWVGCAASVYHPYKYGGTYAVTLTITDVGGNTASTTHEITVKGAGPPAPSSSTSAGGSGTPTPVVSKVAAVPTASASIPLACCPQPRVAALSSATPSASRWPDTSRCCSQARSTSGWASEVRPRPVCPRARLPSG